jgi:GTP cyclohydrolase II
VYVEAMGRTPSRINKGVPRRAKPLSAVGGVERAAHALRAGSAVAIADDQEIVIALAVERASEPALAAFRKAAKGNGRLVLTHNRARTLKIRLYTPDVTALALEPAMTADGLRAIADPTFDLAAPLKGPFAALRDVQPQGFAAGIRLAKLAGLLPAILAARVARAPTGSERVGLADISAYETEAVRTLGIVTRARVPLEGAPKTEIVAFRPQDGGPEHFAIVIDAPLTSKPVLARLHSECFTGDLLHSLKCDCGAQLRGAIEAIAKEGSGVLLYLAQEGRGIGLMNKLRAYRLQDQGFDTMEANERLGFESDERLYGIAARMLGLLGYKSVRLLTNNPDKVTALKASGVKVVARVPHKFPDNEHNRAYLRTKAEKAGHFL